MSSATSSLTFLILYSRRQSRNRTDVSGSLLPSLLCVFYTYHPGSQDAVYITDAYAHAKVGRVTSALQTKLIAPIECNSRSYGIFGDRGHLHSCLAMLPSSGLKNGEHTVRSRMTSQLPAAVHVPSPSEALIG